MVVRLVKPVRPWRLKVLLSLRRARLGRLWPTTKRKRIKGKVPMLPHRHLFLCVMQIYSSMTSNIIRARPGRKFCVSDIRQSQEYHVINVHIWGLFPLVTAFPGGWGGMRAEGRECRHGLPGTLFQGDQPTLRSANMMSS